MLQTKHFNLKEVYIKKKRTNYLINPKFQISFVAFSLGMSMTGMTVVFLTIKYFFWTFNNLGQELNIPSDHIFFRFINDQSDKMTMVFLIALLIVFIITTVGAVLMSHKVAGPIYKLTKYFKEAANNNGIANEVKFRADDYFIELQEAVNEFMKSRK